MKIDKTNYKTYTWKHWSVLHWMLNPAIVVNELILGQRISKISLVNSTSDRLEIGRTIIPCTHCGTFHDGRTWSLHNGTAFKNWFGLYCHNCGKIIPCVLNVFSFLVLVLTFPVWGWFAKSLKRQWLDKQPERYQNIDLENMPNPLNKKNFVKIGLIWGAFMFVIMSLIFPYLFGDEITYKSLFIGLIIWAIAGLLLGFVMRLLVKIVLTQQRKSSTKLNNM